MQTNIKHTPNEDTSDCISASELVHRHLQDENHEISEEDLMLVAIDCSDTQSEENAADAPLLGSLDSNLQETGKEKNDSSTEDDIIITPVDVLTS